MPIEAIVAVLLALATVSVAVLAWHRRKLKKRKEREVPRTIYPLW